MAPQRMTRAQRCLPDGVSAACARAPAAAAGSIIMYSALLSAGSALLPGCPGGGRESWAALRRAPRRPRPATASRPLGLGARAVARRRTHLAAVAGRAGARRPASPPRLLPPAYGCAAGALSRPLRGCCADGRTKNFADLRPSAAPACGGCCARPVAAAAAERSDGAKCLA